MSRHTGVIAAQRTSCGGMAGQRQSDNGGDQTRPILLGLSS
jgi:hypothetical protein